MGRAPTFTKLVTLARLQTLTLVEEHGSLRQAAEQTGANADQYSHQIASLARFAKGPLTVQRGGKVVLNERGEALALLARDFMARLADFERAGDTDAPEFSIGAGDALLQWLVVPCLGEIQAAMPGIRLSLRNRRNVQIVRELDRSEIDFGLIRAKSLHRPLLHEPLGRLTYGLAVPRAMLAAAPSRDEDWLLEHLPLAVQSEHSYVETELLEAVRRLGLRLNVRLRADTFPEALAAVRQGRCAAILPCLPGVCEALGGAELLPLALLAPSACEIVLAYRQRMLDMKPDSSAVRLRNLLARTLAWDGA